jgi:hypothetical protein
LIVIRTREFPYCHAIQAMLRLSRAIRADAFLIVLSL